MINDISIVRIEQQAGAGVVITGDGSPIPEGGQLGQILAKASSSNYDLEWVNQNAGIPAGGLDGQYLVKSSNNNYEVTWENPPTSSSTETLIQTVFNDSGSLIEKGSVVYLVGGNGSFPTVSIASAATEHDAQVLGVAMENILNAGYGSIIIKGILDGVNTDAFLLNDRLYLSPITSGAITNVQPSSPDHEILIGYCIKKDLDGSIYVNVENGTHIERLHDVLISSPVTGQALFYSNAGVWVNREINESDIQGLENLVYTTGDQVISGKKVFADNFEVGESSDVATFFVSGSYVGINNETPLANLDVSGTVAFNERPTVNGTGVLLIGESAANLVYTTGDQEISGIKTFVDGIEIGDFIGSTPTLFVDGQFVGINNETPTSNLDVSGTASFSERPTVNGTGVLLVGEVQSNTIISGIVYSAQANVKNDQGSVISKGQPVYIKGANGSNILAGLASSEAESTSSKTLGLVVQDSLAINAFGTVITEGLLENFDVGTAVAGDPIWLGPTGSLIYGLTNKPHSPDHLVYLGVVTREGNNGEVFVHIQNGFEFEELHNAQITGALDGEFVVKSGEYWINQTVTASGLGAISYETGDAVPIYSMRAMTQAEYDLITPDPNTFYAII